MLRIGLIRAPLAGEMPAELAAQASWVYSHRADEKAWIMNLPMLIGGKSYPLFYFYGTVPESAVVAKADEDE